MCKLQMGFPSPYIDYHDVKRNYKRFKGRWSKGFPNIDKTRGSTDTIKRHLIEALDKRILRDFFEKAMEINAIVLDIKDSAPNIS